MIMNKMIFAFLLVPFYLFGQTSQGPNSPSSHIANNVSLPSNAYTQDGSEAFSTTLFSGPYALWKGFGFSIPVDAVIDGILLEVDWCGTTNPVSLYLSDDALMPIGDDRYLGIAGECNDDYSSLGGSSDLWGATLTPAIINASDFGIYFEWGTFSDWYVDHVRITVYYTEAGGGAEIKEVSGITKASVKKIGGKTAATVKKIGGKTF
jgi:hypothetical protein